MAILEKNTYDLSANRRALLESMLRKKGLSAPAARTIKPRAPGAPAPLSFAQQRLWFMEQLEGASALYNVPVAFRLRGPVSIPKLERALEQVVRRHETLRASFPTVNGAPAQAIAPHFPVPLHCVDLSGLAPEACEREAYMRVREESRRPFNLAEGPLLRGVLLRLSNDNHVVLLTMHHIIADGWSMKVLAAELAAFSAGTPLPELPVQYADFAAWQREWLTGGVLESQMAYWKKALEHAPGVLELPSDRQRPSEQRYEGARHPIAIPRRLTGDLKALGRQENATFFMVLLAAWQTLLFRYTGQTDIVVGSPIANRRMPELEQLIGFFVNMLPLRSRLDPSASFRALLRQVREATLHAYEHQDVPFEKLLDELQIPRDLSRTPLFQTVLVLQNASEDLSRHAGRDIEIFHVDMGVAKFDLTLDLAETPEGAAGFLEYRTDLFDAWRVDAMRAHLLNLLDAIAANPDTPLAELPLLDNREHARLTRAAAAHFAVTETIHQRFEAQAARTPDAPALTFEGETLTYGELNLRADRLARRLRAMGAGPEARVGLCLERSLDMVVAIIAILKTGAAYVPIDPSCPRDRVEYILRDSNAPVLVTHSSKLDSLGAAGRIVCVDRMEDAAEASRPLPSVSPAGAAYVIYTSGSTGKPKGVVVGHAEVIRLLDATDQWFHFDSSDVWTLFHSFAFDFSVWEIWGALLYGGRLVVVPYWVSRSPEAFYRMLCDEGVTVLNQTPSAFRQLIQAEEAAGVSPALRLRYVVFGGEALELQSLAPWYRRHPDSPLLVNMYGITETTVHVTYRPLSSADLSLAGKSVIGVPIPDLQVYLLDARLQPVPVGIPGEIHVGGAGVARGYLNCPELTATRFVPDPFSAHPGQRLYRSGDLARYLPNGELEYLGRIDHQVKIRGFRIEIGEIESVLNQHPGVREVTVIARADVPGEPRLVAYFVPMAQPAPQPAELRAHLKQQLPDYMIPTALVEMEALPLTSNGKVDRRALPAPEESRPTAEGPYAAPETDTEQALAAIWEQVLRIPRVGLHDNFFDLGGDSILSIQVVSRAGRQGVSITTKQLFQNQTVASLAAAADSGRAGRREVAQAKPGPAPLTPIQRWFFEQNLEHPDQWNQAVLLELKQPLGMEVLSAAVEAVFAHHDAFRLRFEREPAGWRQTDSGISAKVTLESYDSVETAASSLHAGLSLAEGRLARVAYVAAGPRGNPCLLLVAHHLVVDGVSWRMLVEDLEIACRQLSIGQAPQLPPATTPFTVWAERLAEHAASDSIANEAGFWREQLRSAPNGHCPANTEGSVCTVSTSLDEEQTRAVLQEVPKVYRTQINDVLLAALAMAHDGVLVDLEGHGREPLFDDLDTSRTAGWFTSIFPVFLEAPAGRGPGETLKSVKEALRRIPNRGIGYGVARYLRDGGQFAAADPPVSFNYLGRLDAGESGDRLFEILPGQWGHAHHPSDRRPHAIDVVAYTAGGRLHVDWIYSTSLHGAAAIERFAHSYLEAVKNIVEHCKSPEAGGFTPSDFPKAQISQKNLDRLMSKLSGGRNK